MKTIITLGNHCIIKIESSINQTPYFSLESLNREPEIYSELDQAINIMILRQWRGTRGESLSERLAEFQLLLKQAQQELDKKKNQTAE